MVKRSKRDNFIDAVFFLVVLGAASVFTFILFKNQVYAPNPDVYHSDMKAYILETIGQDSGYSFPYPILFKLSAFIHLFVGPEISVAIATLLLNSLGMVLIKYELEKTVGSGLYSALGKYGYLEGVLISLAGVGLFFVSMIFIPFGLAYFPGIKFNYLGVFSGNPFHNATYMAARPFSILAFFSFVELLSKYEKGYAGEKVSIVVRDYLLFSLYLLLATMAKPAFTLVFVATAGLIMLYRMMVTRFKNFVQTVCLGLCFIPTFIDMLYQYKGVFVPDSNEVGGIGFGIGKVWTLYCDNIPLGIILAIFFPIVVLLINAKEFKINNILRFSWQMYLCSFVMAFFLYEKGFREPDFNFSWGYICGIFFVFVGSLVVLLEQTGKVFYDHQNFSENKDKKIFWNKLLIWAQWGAFCIHLICGLIYFANIYMGGTYY